MEQYHSSCHLIDSARALHDAQEGVFQSRWDQLNPLKWLEALNRRDDAFFAAKAHNAEVLERCRLEDVIAPEGSTEASRLREMIAFEHMLAEHEGETRQLTYC